MSVRWLLFMLLLVPLAAAQTGSVPADPLAIVDLTVTAGSHRVDLAWSTAQQDDSLHYVVRVFANAEEIILRNTTKRQETFLLENGVPYAFTVTAVAADGREGPPSAPVAATPRLENDFAYLAAGLIAVWIGLLGYAAFLARKENAVNRKLDRLLEARFQGRSP